MRKCDSCYFGDKCSNPYGCDHYTPLEGIAEENIDPIIEKERRNFLQQWEQYISEYDD